MRHFDFFDGPLLQTRYLETPVRHLLIAAMLLPLPAAAQDFDCRNTGAETRCDQGKCEFEKESFTPLQLTRRGATLELCAYSGCWHGPILVRRTRGGIYMLFADLRTSAAGPGGGSIAVLYDRGERVAQMRWGGFANTMTCE